jgi:O-antigen/teichoic acid export membrane protein
MATEPKNGSLRQRVLRAGNWIIAGHILGQALRLGTNLVMTRVLVPEMFGIMALANVIMFGLQMISDLGLRQNIVQSQRGNDAVFLNTVWTVQIVRGALLWITTLCLALAIFVLAQWQWWPAGSVYAEPVLPWVIACLAFSALLSGFESTKLATANRNLALGRVTLIELVCQAAALASMLVWASVDRSIWALVIGAMVFGVLKVLLSHVSLPGEGNKLHWNQDAFKEIFGFGKWVFLSSTLSFLAASGDRFLLGGLTDSATLGLYSIALFMVSAFRDVFIKLIGNVALPALGEIVRERPMELKQMYYRLRAPLDAVTLLATGCLFAAGHLLIVVLYDERYLAAGHMLEVLAIGLFEVRYSLVVQCLLAIGKPRYLVPITAIRLIALYVLLPVAFARFGMEGALWVISLSYLLTLPYIAAIKLRYGLLDLGKELRVLPLLMIGYAIGWLLDRVIAGQLA